MTLGGGGIFKVAVNMLIIKPILNTHEITSFCRDTKRKLKPLQEWLKEFLQGVRN